MSVVNVRSSCSTPRARNASVEPTADRVKVQILHTNDVHGAITPLKDKRILGRPAELGGSAYLATLVKEQRAENPEGTILIDAGDAVHGQAETDLDEGRPMIEIMNGVGYDAGTIGNHDFQWGVSGLVERLESANFPFLMANVTDDQGAQLPNSTPFKIFDLQGAKVAVVGLLTEATKIQQRADKLVGVEIESERSTIEKALPELRSQGADVVVVLTHCGLKGDKKLAEAFPGENLFIIGGHSHHRIEEPLEVAGNRIVQAGAMGKELGVLNLEIDPRTRTVIGVDHQLIAINHENIEPDPEIAAIVGKYKAIADEELGKTVYTLESPLTRHGQQDSSMGNLVTDSMRWAATEVVGKEVDLAFMNSDGLRKRLPEGDMTLRDLYEIMPFGGELMVGSISGSKLKELIEHSVDTRADSPDNWHAPFLQLSGARMVYDASRPKGDKVLSFEVGGKPLDPEATYTVALEDYIANGALGFSAFAESEWEDASMTVNDTVRDFILEGHFEEAEADGRIDDRTP